VAPGALPSGKGNDMQQRKRARDFDPRILEIYDGYVHGKMSKRQFLNLPRNTPSAG
jgi:carboxymethylenebutenolidase